VVSEQYSETVPAGRIISTDPSPGDKIPDGDTVEVVISKGKERHEVPPVLGKTVEVAAKMLEDANLEVGEVTKKHNGKYEEGTVAETSIKPGTDVKTGTIIDLVISTGPVPVRIPDFTGSWAGEAKSGLDELGFDVEAVREHSEEIAPNRVISQDPSGGIGHKGDTITLTVSAGPSAVPVPDVFGWELKDAAKAMKDAGFKIDVVRADNYLGLKRIAAQDPPANSTLPWGSTVTLTIV